MAPEATVRRGTRRTQHTYVWLATITANDGICAYCAISTATTLDHEEPVADEGADVWWNFIPACKPCNDWKAKRTARQWLTDQKLHRDRPEVGFDTRMMPMRMILGFEDRLEKVRRRIRDADRRDWFRHHFGAIRHRNKEEMWEHLSDCEAMLARYPFKPWTTPNVGPDDADTCRRHMCCGWRHPDATTISAVILAPDDRTHFARAAYEAGLSEGDLTARLIRDHLARRTIPTQRRP
ncbi:HNH endonuclease [Kitasatospora sp. NPDC127059]|uniref:HNH endonuclease n=1 Tax=unclassified Kitasatospora TaxID=2633591 RepID=UPI00366609E4